MKQLLKHVVSCMKVMLISITGYAQTNITQAEYFFDADPGYGNGTSIAIGSPAINLTTLSFNASVTALSSGIHILHVRSKNASGTWSQTNKAYIAKVQMPGTNPATVSNITQAEYFFDTDPGIGNGTSISLTSGTNISGAVFNVNIAPLTTGIHSLYVRTKDASGWSMTHRLLFAKYQPLGGNPATVTNITKAEYFYDSDPGYGNGNSMAVTPATDLSGQVFNLSVTSLSAGVHTLYIRTADAQGKWSETQKLTFAKFQSPAGNPNTISNIVKAEYFFNSDPGFGNGVNVPVTAANDINGLVVNANVASMPTGLHTIYLRTQDAQGKWSITGRLQFSRIQGLQSNPHPLSRINKAEYFYDTDPGYGLGTDIPVAPSYDLNQITFNVNVTSLNSGVHTLYVRTRDSLGQWSELNRLLFVKVQAPGTNPHTISNITKAEYYFDNDPGYGLGTDVPVTAATDISAFSFTANVASLSNGVHTLYFRTKDAGSKWSEVNRVVFAKVQSLSGNPHTVSNIVQLEYFVDTDPGIGNGLPVPITPASDISNVAFNVDMTVLVNAAHKLYIRAKDAQGKWSITNIHSFNGGTAALAIKLLSFEASLQKAGNVLLHWITAEEQDVAHYTIERSYDAANWVYVGQQSPVVANEDGTHTYRMVDEHPGTGIVYYRLTETDVNGKTTQAPIRFVRINDDVIASSLYPNPSNGKKITIASSFFAEGAMTLTIISEDGKVYLSQPVNDPSARLFTLSALSLPDGNYFVVLKNKNKTETLKLHVVGERF